MESDIPEKTVSEKTTLKSQTFLYFLLVYPTFFNLDSWLHKALPNSLFYLNNRFAFLTGGLLTPLNLFVLLLCWYVCRNLALLRRKITSTIGVVYDSCFITFFILSTLGTCALGGGPLSTVGRFGMGYAHCQNPLVSNVFRCEGRDESFRDSFWVAAVYGEPVDNIESVIKSLDRYRMEKTDCQSLPGKFGERCYIGNAVVDKYGEKTMAVYLTGNKILTLETEHVGIPFESYHGDDYWVDMERFRKEMESK